MNSIESNEMRQNALKGRAGRHMKFPPDYVEMPCLEESGLFSWHIQGQNAMVMDCCLAHYSAHATNCMQVLCLHAIKLIDFDSLKSQKMAILGPHGASTMHQQMSYLSSSVTTSPLLLQLQLHTRGRQSIESFSFSFWSRYLLKILLPEILCMLQANGVLECEPGGGSGTSFSSWALG